MNEYIEGYHTDEEKLDYERFVEFAADFPVMFNIHRETAYGCPFDVLNRTATGGTYAIELKSRYKEYDDCYIEWDKFSKMRELWRNQHFLPVYINFYKDAVYLWKLNDIEKINVYLNVWIKPKKGEPYEGDRIGLNFNEAYKFIKKNGKYVCVYKPDNDSGVKPPYYDTTLMNQEITKYNYYKLCQTANQE